MLPSLIQTATTTPNPYWEVFGRLHPLLLHFPIALIVIGAIWAVALWLLRKDDGASTILRLCIWGGFVGAIAAAWAGWTLADHQQDQGRLVDLHRWFSVAVVATMALTAILDCLRRCERMPWAAGGRVLALVVSGILVMISGHFGAEMKWGTGWVLAPLQAPTADAPTGTSSSAEAPTPSTSGHEADSDTAPAATDADAQSNDTQDDSDTPVDTTSEAGDAPAEAAAAAVTWAQAQPILDTHCARCHGPDRQKAGLQIVPWETLFPDNTALWVVTPGQPDQSSLLHRVQLPADDADIMPPDGPPLSAEDQATLVAWVKAGAPGPDGATPPTSEDSTEAAPAVGAPVASNPAAATRTDPTSVAPEAHDTAAASAAVEALRARGITVRPLHVGSRWLEVSLARVQPAVTDADLEPLAALAPVLWSLDASGSALTDAGMAMINACTALRSLRLGHTAVGDGGVAALTGLQSLEVLNLYASGVNDGALAAIESLAALKAVYLGGTKVTLEGLAQLRSARPNVAVHGDAALASPDEPADG